MPAGAGWATLKITLGQAGKRPYLSWPPRPQRSGRITERSGSGEPATGPINRDGRMGLRSPPAILTRLAGGPPVFSGLDRSLGLNLRFKPGRSTRKTRGSESCRGLLTSGRPDLNRRPLDPQSSALPDCATSRVSPSINGGPVSSLKRHIHTRLQGGKQGSVRVDPSENKR